jgi:hypothetical protein
VSVAGPRGLEIASLRRRGVASVIDLGVFVPPLVLAGLAGFGLYEAFGGDERDGSSYRRALQSQRFQLASVAVSALLGVALRNSRSPGARVLGLRRADARTGGPVSVRSALGHVAVDTASGRMNRRALRPLRQRAEERLKVIEAELAELRRIHAGDDEALRRAMFDLSKRHRATSAGACGRVLLGVVPLYLPALWSARNQTLPDRIAGIIVVRD